MHSKRLAAFLVMVAALFMSSIAMARPAADLHQSPSLTQRYKHLYYTGRRDGIQVGKYKTNPTKTYLIHSIHRYRRMRVQWKRVSSHFRFMNCVGSKESGGRYQAVSPNGTYRGKYQFDLSTWAAAGGSPRDPINAPPAAQDAAFLRWYPGHPGAWPRTGPACGGPAAF